MAAQGKKGRKFGRNGKKPCMKAYHAADRASINKRKRAERHAKKHPNDKGATVVYLTKYKEWNKKCDSSMTVEIPGGGVMFVYKVRKVA